MVNVLLVEVHQYPYFIVDEIFGRGGTDTVFFSCSRKSPTFEIQDSGRSDSYGDRCQAIKTDNVQIMTDRRQTLT